MNTNRREILKATAANHRRNLIKSLERRMERARARGDEKLVRQLEAEAHYLNLR